ncbi:MAG TPA: hypothetical protein VGB71_02060 [Flavisolibacter sp.]
MKKSIFVTGFAVVLMLAASAQISQKDQPPKPPVPPKAPVERPNDVPPPPPPPPSEPPAPNELPPPPEPPIPPSPADEGFLQDEDYEAFLQRNPSVKSLGWNFENEVIVRLKSGKEERYKLDNEASRKAAETKYGKLPAAPPPPPPPPAPPRRKGMTTLS